MKKTLFIADLHLDEAHPETIKAFLDFLNNIAPEADALYILGDFFEVWIGDDEKTPLQQGIQTALSRLKIPVYFMHGNRDFLLGKRFAAGANMEILQDPAPIKLYGQAILLMHGDSLCTNDVKYQAFRKKARNKFYQKLFLLLPLAVRRRIANKMREKSKQHTGNTQLDIMDVSRQAVLDALNHYQIPLLIHGHTHRPKIHQGDNFVRAVLPAWDQKPGYLAYQESGELMLKYLI